jgi:hypothetical protein
MKKNKNILAGTLVLMCFFVTTAFSQGIVDTLEEGKKLVKGGQLLIADGQVLQNCTGQDRGKMVDEGNRMIRKGRDIISEGTMMATAVGRDDGLKIGQSMISGGNMLVEKGKQQGELTANDIEKIKKIGNDMVGLGKLMLQKGKIKTGE